jgi:hypothetical protein
VVEVVPEGNKEGKDPVEGYEGREGRLEKCVSLHEWAKEGSTHEGSRQRRTGEACERQRCKQQAALAEAGS